MEETKYRCLNCGEKVVRNGAYYRCSGCGDSGNISELIKKQSKLEQSIQSDEHPFGEWGKAPLSFP